MQGYSALWQLDEGTRPQQDTWCPMEQSSSHIALSGQCVMESQLLRSPFPFLGS